LLVFITYLLLLSSIDWEPRGQVGGFQAAA
jgi:hypothetical protein